MLVWDALALPPSLNGCVVLMAQLASQTPDAATLSDKLFVGDHSVRVRHVRTFVNPLDNVRSFCDDTYMTTGEKLLDLKKRAGDLTLDEIARDSGYAGKSSVQEYFKPAFDGPLSSKIAEKLGRAFIGRGVPAITAEEFATLSGPKPETNATPVKFEGAPLADKRLDLPVYGTALGAAQIVDGEAIEQTELNTGEIIQRIERPPVLNGVPNAYGLYTQGSSMAPRYDDGELVVANDKQPPRIGDDVVVYLRHEDDSDDGERARMVMVKRLVRRTAQYYELRQFQPDLTFRIPMSSVLKMHRIVPPSEWLMTR